MRSPTLPLLATVWGLLAAPASRAEPPNEPAKELLSKVPFNAWPASRDHEVGMLYEADSSPWGSLGLRNPKAPLSLGHDAYHFCRDGKSCQAVYFPSRGGGINFITGWIVPLPDGGPSKPTDVAALGPGVKNDFGLRKAAHLVRLEVNGGQGSPGGLDFIATAVELLDGTSGYELVPATALDEARRRFDVFAAAQRKPMDEALAAAHARDEPVKTAPVKTAPPPSEVEEQVFPSWHQADRTLSVLFIQRLSSTGTQPYTHRRTFACPKGAPCRPAEMVTEPELRRHSLLLGYSATFDHAGKLIDEKTYGPTKVQ